MVAHFHVDIKVWSKGATVFLSGLLYRDTLTQKTIGNHFKRSRTVNREKAIRSGFSGTIKNILIYKSQQVHVYDETTTLEVPGEKLYALLTQQTANNDADYTQFRWRCTQTIEIVSKQISSVSKDIVDEISEQMEQALIYPTDQTGNGTLTPQAGWEFSDVLLENVNYTEFQLNTNTWEITKILTFSLIITKL